jgi:hypothetical protein
VEIWKKIEGFDYAVSSMGRVRSEKTSRILKPWKQASVEKDSYLQVGLMKSGKRHKFLVHRLVAENFVENVGLKPQVNHKDLNRMNNLSENLEWVTCSENVLHSNLNRDNNIKVRKRYSLELIKAALSFEGSQEAACREFGIRRKSLIYWKNKLREISYTE